MICRWPPFILLLALGLCPLLACDDEPSDGDGDADVDADADGDGDADGDSGPLHVEEEPGCDPLIPEVCAFPFPSMYYLTEDVTTPTGYRAALTEEAMPTGSTAPEVFVGHFNEADGYSISTPLLALFPDGPIDSESLPTVLDLAPSVTADSAIQVFDRDTGERLPVWAELDLHGSEPEEQTLIIRPMTALPFGTRVAVAVTDSLRLEDGSPPSPPAPFAALRDGVETDSAIIEGRRERFEALFEFLAEQGLERERLLLAWEVVTSSAEFNHSVLPPMVEEAVSIVEATPPTYSIVRCVSSDEVDQTTFGCDAQEPDGPPLSPLTWRRIYGRVDLPLFLDDDQMIRLDDAGRPEASGTISAEFVVNVPSSLRLASAGSAPVVVFGHGLLVEPQRYLADDLDSNGQMELADRLGAIFIGTRWLGLSSTELVAATNVIYDFGNSFTFAAMLHQGITNQVLMPPFATGALRAEPLLEAADGSGSLIDGDHLFYTGISQGGIFGTTFMALSPHVRTGVLHVPGSAYSHMLAHSVDFSLFQTLLEGAVGDPRGQQMFLALAQRLFDAGDPINYIGNIVDDPLTDLGPKSCLWQCSIGDSQAVWYGCDMMMRTGGFPIAGPPTTEVFGLEVIETPTAPGTSAMQQFDPGLGLPPLTNDELEATGAHTAIRRNDEVQLQTVDYFDLTEPGRVVNHCGGACVVDPVPDPADEE